MAAIHSRCIVLTNFLAHYVDSRVALGKHASASEILGNVLRLGIERDEAATARTSARILRSGQPHDEV